MRIGIIVVAVLAAALGCARVQVQAPKEPIKVDISMRLDVYQHVEKDIDAIESIVTGSAAEPQSRIDRMLSNFTVEDAFAAELSPEVEAAAIRRRDRRAELVSWQSQGVIGENKSGLLEIRDAGRADSSVEALVRDENSDRMAIYQSVAESNGTSVGEVQKMYAKRLQGDAPAGTPIEVVDDASGSAGWQTK